jgi:hypothetical protein
MNQRIQIKPESYDQMRRFIDDFEKKISSICITNGGLVDEILV